MIAFSESVLRISLNTLYMVWIAQYTIWQHKLFSLTYRKYCWYIKFVRTTNHLNRCCLQIISYMFGLEIVFIRNIKNCVCDVVWRFIGLSFLCIYLRILSKTGSVRLTPFNHHYPLLGVCFGKLCFYDRCVFSCATTLCFSLCGASNPDDELL